MVVDFRRWIQPAPAPICIQGAEVEFVSSHRYLGVQLDNKLDWQIHVGTVCKKGQSRLYFLRRLRSFNICQPLLHTVYHSVVASALFFAVACWGEGSCLADRNRVDTIIKKASSVVNSKLDTVQQMAEDRMLSKMRTILRNTSHPLNALGVIKRSTFSERLIMPRCKSERSRRSFLPAAIKLFNEHF